MDRQFSGTDTALHFNMVEGESNLRLRGERPILQGVVYTSVETPDGGTWENEGGCCAPEPEIIESVTVGRPWMKARGPRKQTAARMFIPRESIKKVPLFMDVLTNVLKVQKQIDA